MTGQNIQGTLDHYQNNSTINRTTKKNLWCMVIPNNGLNLCEDRWTGDNYERDQ